MENKTHKLMELMAAGHDIEIIMDILGIDDSELFEMMMEIVDVSSTPAPPTKTIPILYTTEFIKTDMIGKVEFNLN